ncbi:MAG: hypothetical protein K2O91_09600 [Lachnospiraceae bacterium]|nr:hypothetical protein [Lachnospiraceae bacterium]
MIRELTADVEYLMDAKEVSLDCTVEPACIEVEYDLFKTLFLNLLDNTIKAGAKHIHVIGDVKKMEKGMYFVMQVSEDGSGIPKQEIKWITEAFYMVDKLYTDSTEFVVCTSSDGGITANYADGTSADLCSDRIVDIEGAYDGADFVAQKVEVSIFN